MLVIEIALGIVSALGACFCVGKVLDRLNVATARIPQAIRLTLYYALLTIVVTIAIKFI